MAVLLNFSRHRFELEGAVWPTSEHYFQHRSSRARPYARNHPPGRTARGRALGSRRSQPLRPDWEQVKDEVMPARRPRKFEAHVSIRAVLLATGDEAVVENALAIITGLRRMAPGRNKLGKYLWKVRARLKTTGHRNC